MALHQDQRRLEELREVVQVRAGSSATSYENNLLTLLRLLVIEQDPSSETKRLEWERTVGWAQYRVALSLVACRRADCDHRWQSERFEIDMLAWSMSRYARCTESYALAVCAAHIEAVNASAHGELSFARDRSLVLVEHLENLPPGAVTASIFRNIAGAFAFAKDEASAEACLSRSERMAHEYLAPGSVDLWVRPAMVAMSLGDLHSAERYLMLDEAAGYGQATPLDTVIRLREQGQFYLKSGSRDEGLTRLRQAWKEAQEAGLEHQVGKLERLLQQHH